MARLLHRRPSAAQGDPPPFAALVARLAPSGPAPRVALIGDRPDPALPAALTAACPAVELHRMPSRLSDDELHVRLAALGPFDLIVDAARGWGRYERARRLFFHLDAGGRLMVRRHLPPGPRAPGPKRWRVRREASELGRLLAVAGEGGLTGALLPRSKARTDDDRLGRAIRSAELVDGHLVLTSDVRAWAKLREEQAELYLRLRGPGVGRVLRTVPAEVFASRAQVREGPYDRPHRTPSSFDVPAHAVREYHEVLCTPGQIVTRDQVILPETFRHNQRPRLRNRYVTEVAPAFGLVQPPWFAEVLEGEAAPRLKGGYFYLDSEYRGHYGHLTTEILSRLWAWAEAKRSDPALRALMHLNKHRELGDYEVEMLSAAGVAPEDVVFERGPVVVERLVAATPMFSQPDYVHPGIVAVWARVGDHLVAQAPDRDYPRRIFCARRIAKRPCINAAEVEALFEAEGFTVVHTEDHRLPEQARMFRDAEVVAGFAGSAMFNLIFSREPTRIVLVSSEAYSGRNELLIAAALGHRLDIAWCRPVVRPDDRPGRASMHAPFVFDHDREGRFVRSVLGELGRPAGARR